MSFSELPAALKPEEVAAYLRVRPEVVHAEIRAGNLKTMRIGSESRIRKEDLLQSLSSGMDPTTQTNDQFSIDQIRPAPAFEWKWPVEKAKAGEQRPERFPEALRTRVRLVDGTEVPILIGVTEREAAGKPDRKRVLVIVEGTPTSEFAGSNDSKLMAGIIKPDPRSPRHLKIGEPLPAAYESFQTRPYNEIIVGPHAAHGMAVVCEPQDYPTMVRHALIRWMSKRASRV